MQLIYGMYVREHVSAAYIKLTDYSNSAGSCRCFFARLCDPSHLRRESLCFILVHVRLYITRLIYVPVLVRAGVFGALNMCACVRACVFVCCQALAVSSAWMTERAINTWGSRNTQTLSPDCIYGHEWGGDGGVGMGWSWGKGGGVSRHAQLSSGCGQDPTKTPGLLKPPWMSPRGHWSGRNAGLGLEVQGYVLLLMSSPHWASLALSPRLSPQSHQRCHNQPQRPEPAASEACYTHSLWPWRYLQVNRGSVETVGGAPQHEDACVCMCVWVCIKWDVTTDDAGQQGWAELLPKWCMHYMLY